MPSLNKNFLGFVFIFLANVASAQIPWAYLSQPDTTKVIKIRPYLNFDNRKLFVNQSEVRQLGLNAGIKFGKKDSRLTIGYYWLNFTDKFINYDQLLNNPLNFNFYKPTSSHFMNLKYEQGIINSKRFVLKAPLELGYGSYDSVEQPFWDDKRTISKANFTPMQVGLYTELKVVRHFGIYGKIGSYNFFNCPNSKFNKGLYYRINIKINADLILKDAHKLAKYYQKKKRNKK